MSRQTRPFLRIAAIANALLLLTVFVAFRMGVSSPQTVIQTVDVDSEPNRLLDLNSIENQVSSPYPQKVGAEFPELESLTFYDVEPQRLRVPTGVTDTQLHAASFNEPIKRPSRSSAGPREGNTGFAVHSQFVDDSGHRGGAHVPEQIRRDILTLMSGSKSAVVVPSTALEWQRAFEKFKSGAAQFFSHIDRNQDGKLTEDEFPVDVWKKLVEKDAVKDNAVHSDEFLKHYAWISSHKHYRY